MFKKCSERITLIKTKAENEMPAIMANLKNPSEEDWKKYQSARVQLNELLIMTVIGAEMADSRKGKTLKFNYPVPTTEELAEICKIMKKFSVVEAEFCNAYHKAKQAVAAAENKEAGKEIEDSIEDLGVAPDEKIMYSAKYEDIDDLSKVNKKNLKDEILKNGLTGRMIGVDGIMTIAGWGSKVRKDRNLQILLISLAAGVAVAGGVAGGVYYYHKTHNDEIDGGNDFDVIDTIDVDDSAAPEVDDSDAPVVDFE